MCSPRLTRESDAPSPSRRSNLDDEAERVRLLRAGGKSGQELLAKHVSVPGVEGSLKVTRSLGDSPFHKDDVVSSTPGIRHFALSPATRFLVIASDGIWDHLSNEQVRPPPDQETCRAPAQPHTPSVTG